MNDCFTRIRLFGRLEISRLIKQSINLFLLFTKRTLYRGTSEVLTKKIQIQLHAAWEDQRGP